MAPIAAVAAHPRVPKFARGPAIAGQPVTRQPLFAPVGALAEESAKAEPAEPDLVARTLRLGLSSSSLTPSRVVPDSETPFTLSDRTSPVDGIPAIGP
jgi:hypothetical protein